MGGELKFGPNKDRRLASMKQSKRSSNELLIGKREHKNVNNNFHLAHQVNTSTINSLFYRPVVNANKTLSYAGLSNVVVINVYVVYIAKVNYILQAFFSLC